MTEILDQLNEAQQRAVTAPDGPAMVIAGAGSGKTRVLTFRIAYLLNKGVDPFNILALTFTNKAAREMKERIMELVGSTEGKNVWMGTFHSIFARILRIEGHRLGYQSNFTIYDTDDSKSVIKNIIKDLNLDIKQYPPGMVLGRISSAKSNLFSAEDYNHNPEIISQDNMAQKPMIGEIYDAYEKRCFKAGAMDFDDLLFKMNILLRNFPEVLYKYQGKFKYILVDEYQDTNHAQYLIVKQLAARHENICVVGDDAQSIYSFRGANIQNILNFQRDYPDAKIYKLEQNYRSTQTIVNAANSIIAINKDQIFKEVWTQNEEGNLIQVFKAASETEEGQMVANSIFEMKMNDHQPNSAFAILYRTNAQSRALEESLRKLNIPYRIYGGLSFYKRAEIKDMLAYFRLVVNPADDEAFRRIINYPSRGIGKTTLEKIEASAGEHNITSMAVALDPVTYLPALPSGTANKISEFATMIMSLHYKLHKTDAYDLALKINSSSGIMRELMADRTEEGISKLQNAEELVNAVKDFVERDEEPVPLMDDDVIISDKRTLDVFMQDISLMTDADEDDKEKNGNKVMLMTIHAAKGLEFPYVYIVGLEENLFPSNMSLTTRAEIEEERRLFYVALTRAKKKVTLSYAETRYRWGNMTANEKSRFLAEIDDKYLQQTGRKKLHISTTGSSSFIEKLTNFSKKPVKQPAPPPSTMFAPNYVTPVDKVIPGVEVIHERFGKGKVINIEGTGPNTKATVSFEEHGQKQLLLRFAKLKILD
ncbi:MAG TPA: UvrD-helicase domain-containing protein [Lentimicrobium sp.]|nr:UvrD-helicase domain-containing protein [Lentimicrobium sp.]